MKNKALFCPFCCIISSNQYLRSENQYAYSVVRQVAITHKFPLDYPALVLRGYPSLQLSSFLLIRKIRGVPTAIPATQQEETPISIVPVLLPTLRSEKCPPSRPERESVSCLGFSSPL